MCRSKSVIALSSLSASTSSRLGFQPALPESHLLAHLIRSGRVLPATEAPHKPLLPLSRSAPRSPAQTARRGEVERTVTSGHFRESNTSGPTRPAISLMSLRGTAWPSPRPLPPHLITHTRGKGFEAQAAEETGFLRSELMRQGWPRVSGNLSGSRLSGTQDSEQQRPASQRRKERPPFGGRFSYRASQTGLVRPSESPTWPSSRRR
jgi:hypothetical protein